MFLKKNGKKPITPGDEILIRFGNSEMKVRVLETPEHVTKDGAAMIYEIIG